MKIVLDKQKIRTIMKEKRLLHDEKTLFIKSSQIIDTVLSHPEYQQAKCVGIYVSLPKEVYTIPLIEHAFATKIVCTPRIENGVMHFYAIQSLQDLKEGHFHVLEPTTNQRIKPQAIDCMIVPMLAYDKRNYRVGYGKGYYDKYFHSGYRGYKLGLAYDFQEVDHIDEDQYDIALDEIISK